MWEYLSKPYSIININFCAQDAYRELTMMYQPDADQVNTFFYTESTFAGMIQAKLSTDATFMTLGTYSKTPTCYLGDLLASTAYTVDFKMRLTTAILGEQFVPIYIGYGENISKLDLANDSDYWDGVWNLGFVNDTNQMNPVGWTL